MESWSFIHLIIQNVLFFLFQFSKEKYNTNDDTNGNPKGMIEQNLCIIQY